MNIWENKGFKIENLNIPVPIIQGGMGIGVSLSNLASAVANQGGVGVLSAAGIGLFKKNKSNALALQNEIREAKSKTNGVLGVNIMVALTDFDIFVETALKEKIDIIFAGAGLPLNLPKFLYKGCETKLVPIVSSAKAANIIYKWWTKKFNYIPDAFVIEGPLAGGHLGFSAENIEDPAYSLENLFFEIQKEIEKLNIDSKKPIPLIVAGGIFDGKDIYKFLKLGAAGVQMATRFVATEECDASGAFKQAYIDCKKEDIGIIKSPVGMPGRAIINDFLKRAQFGQTKPKSCKYSCIISCEKENSCYCISSALINACHGNFDKGFAFIGANGYRVNKIKKVSELFNILSKEYREALQSEPALSETKG